MRTYTQSAELLTRSKKVLAGGVSSEFRKYGHPHALFYSHGRGAYLYDVDGNEYLDYTLSQGPLILGHSNEEVLNAVDEYSRKGQLFAGQHIKEVELAEALNRHIPSAEMMRFCLDGSEAVQTAFRIARAKTGRSKFLRFEGQYHGWLDNVAWGFNALPAEELGSRENPVVKPWCEGLPLSSRDEFITIPWNDAELLKKVVSERHTEIAAIITEPVMCNAGCIPPAAGYLQALRELCSAYGIALIFDEVITGFRTSIGGAQKLFGIVPDLSIFAKAMGNGYPISIIAGKKDWMALVDNSRVIHAGTLNGGNPTVAAALKTIEILERDQVTEDLFRLGKKLMTGIREIARESGANLLVQGLGPMFHTGFTDLHSVSDFRDTLSYDKKKLNQFISQMHEKGIRIISRGLWYISASHTDEHVEHTLNVVRDVLQEMSLQKESVL